MSTWAVISVKQEDGSYKSISVAKDGYVQNPGVGYMLSSYYLYPEIVEKLISLGNISDNLGMKPNENNTGRQLKKHDSLESLVDYCVDKMVDYLYVYTDRKWSYKKIGLFANGYELQPLTTHETLDYVDREKVDTPSYCSYRTAVRWGDTNLVLLNNIKEIDQDFDPYSSFYENSNEDDETEIPEFYQYYITDLSDDSVEWSRKVFPDLTYVYSELLDSWILCVSHYGTSWDYVPTQYIGNLNISKEEFQRFNKSEGV